jgi:trimeric autotransporter adhesin
MSTKTTFKRVALVAVASMGFGVLTSVAPANAADSAAVLPIVSNQTTVRTDDATYDDTVGGTGTAFGLSSTEAAANDFEGAKVKVTYQANSSSPEVVISTVAGAAPSAAASDTVTLGTGVQLVFDNGSTGTNTFGTPASGVYTIAGAADSTAANVIYLNFGRNATPGLYKLWIDGNGDGDWADATGTDDTGTMMIADMPNTVRIRGAVSLGTSQSRVGNGTMTYNVQVRDAGGRDSYLLGTERVRFAVAGGSGSGLTITTPALPTIGSGDLGTTAASRRFQLTVTASTAAGTYTITGTMEGFASTWSTTAATADAVIVADSGVATTAYRLGITSAGANASATAWTAGAAADTTADSADASPANAAALIALDGTNVEVNYLPTTQRTITLEARFASSVSGKAKFTVVGGTVSGVYDGPAERIVDIVTGPLYNTATITYTADYANADEWALFSVASTASNASHVLELGVVYKNPVPGYIEITSPAGSNIRVATGSSNEYLVTVLDQYGSAMANTPVTFTTSAGSRNGSASYTLVTNSTGNATFTHADTYVAATGLTTDAITVTAVNGTSITGTQNVVYGVATTGALSTVVSQPATPGTTATYDTVITTNTAKTVSVDDTPDSTNNADAQTRIADQLLYEVTVTNAAGGLIQGQPVVVTATEGVNFNACSATVGEVSTTVTGKRTTRTCYANASGVVSIQASFTQSGVATVTFTSGSVVSTHSILVLAGAARNIAVTTAGDTVTAKVTDLRGNPVGSHSITMTASGVGRFANGVAINTVSTSSAGEVSYDVFGTSAGDTTITASMAASAETVKIADATWGLPAGNRTASASLSVSPSSAVNTAQAAADAAAEATDAANAATDAANAAAEAADAATAAAQDAADAVAALATSVEAMVNALKRQITSLTNLVIKIQKKVRA